MGLCHAIGSSRGFDQKTACHQRRHNSAQVFPMGALFVNASRRLHRIEKLRLRKCLKFLNEGQECSSCASEIGAFCVSKLGTNCLYREIWSVRFSPPAAPLFSERCGWNTLGDLDYVSQQFKQSVLDEFLRPVVLD